MKILFIFFAVICITSSSFSQQIDVCSSCPISTLQDGIAQAKDFDTIVSKNLEMEKCFTIKLSVML